MYPGKKKERERERVTMGKKERKRKVNYLHAWCMNTFMNLTN